MPLQPYEKTNYQATQHPRHLTWELKHTLQSKSAPFNTPLNDTDASTPDKPTAERIDDRSKRASDT